MLGEWDRSGRHLDQAIALDPLDKRALLTATMLRAAAGDWRRSKELAQQILDLDHRSTVAHSRLIEANRHLGLVGEAREAALGLLPLLGLEPGAIAFETEQDYRRLWAELIDRRLDQPGHRCRGYRAVYLARMGALEEALDLLDIVARSDSWLLPWLLLEPDLAALAGHSRFEAIRDEARRPIDSGEYELAQ